jgi:hypothetical protein
MTSLDYMTDETFRAALLSDLKELDATFENGNIKSAHVLAGSVVEAVVIEHLISANLVTSAEGLKLELAEAIKRCRDHNIISQRTADMSSVVRSYRNLIHPGRMIRLNERITPAPATVAKALATIVIDEIAAARMANYGWTAEQILSKLRRDANVEHILMHLLKKAPKVELKRLLVKVLPDADIAADLVGFESPHVLAALTACFRAAFGEVDEPVRKEVAARFAAMIRSETDSVIESYGDRFFRADDMAFLTEDDQAIVKAHLLGRMQQGMRPAMLEVLSGIGSYLKPDDVLKFIDPLVLGVLKKSIELNAAVSFLGFEHAFHTSAEFDKAAIKRLAAWKQQADERKDETRMEVVEALYNAIDTVPF